MNISAVLYYFEHSSVITYIVLIWLSIYFLLSFTILFSRYSYLRIFEKNERDSLNILLKDGDIEQSKSILKTCKQKEHLKLYKISIQKQLSIGLTWLSVIASTAPFIGLFGTVVSILETFGGLGTQNSLSFIAPKISEALIATGCGILVSIPAYSFHLFIKRKAFEILAIIDSEIELLSLRY